MLLFGACAGRHGGRGRGRGARLLFKACDDDRHVPHGDSQLLGSAPANVPQLGPRGAGEKERVGSSDASLDRADVLNGPTSPDAEGGRGGAHRRRGGWRGVRESQRAERQVRETA